VLELRVDARADGELALVELWATSGALLALADALDAVERTLTGSSTAAWERLSGRSLTKPRLSR
jgi:hypothetical protein